MISRIGLCVKCKRWSAYGQPCTECGSPLDFLIEVDKELSVRLIGLLLATQGLLESEPEVKRIANPFWWPSRTPEDERRAISLLSGIAAMHGLTVEGAGVARASD